MRRRVVTEVNALEREIAAEEKARAKEKQDLIDAENKRIADEKKKADDAKAKADKIAADKEIAEAKRVADEKARLEEELVKIKSDTVAMGFKVGKELAKEGSVAAKGIAVAETIYNTQAAIMQAMKLPPPFNTIQAVATGIMGATSIQKILSTNPEGVGGGGSVSAPATPATPAPQMMSGAFDLSGGIEPKPTRAYVVTDEMTNSQNQLANIRRRATI